MAVSHLCVRDSGEREWVHGGGERERACVDGARTTAERAGRSRSTPLQSTRTAAHHQRRPDPLTTTHPRHDPNNNTLL